VKRGRKKQPWRNDKNDIHGGEEEVAEGGDQSREDEQALGSPSHSCRSSRKGWSRRMKLNKLGDGKLTKRKWKNNES